MMLEVLFSGVDAVAPREFWSATARPLDTLGLAEKEYAPDFAAKGVPFAQFDAALKKRKFRYFCAWGKATQVRLSIIGASTLSIGAIRAPEITTSAASQLVKPWAKHRAFLNARLFDEDYDYWQSEKQIQAYEMASRSLRGLHLTEDPVFEETVIDVSLNAGRTVWHAGYQEAIGHAMWFSPAFWRVVKGTETKARALGKASVVAGLTVIEFSPKPFTRASKLQEDIRAAVFGRGGRRARPKGAALVK